MSRHARPTCASATCSPRGRYEYTASRGTQTAGGCLKSWRGRLALANWRYDAGGAPAPRSRVIQGCWGIAAVAISAYTISDPYSDFAVASTVPSGEMIVENPYPRHACLPSTLQFAPIT